MENEIKKQSTNIGLYLGGALLMIATSVYLIDYSLYLNPIKSVIVSLIIIIAAIYSILLTKNNNAGTVSFTEAFKSYFITVSIGYLIYSIWIFVIYSLIDSEAAKTIDEQAMIMSKEMLENYGLSSEMIAISMDEMSKISNFSLSSIATNFCIKIIGYSFVGLIVSLIFFLLYPTKKD